MVKYQFEVPDDVWTEWKKTVPRDKPLHERIRELLEADTSGRVIDDGRDDQDEDVDEDTGSSGGDNGGYIVGGLNGEDMQLISNLDLPGEGPKRHFRVAAVANVLAVLDEADGSLSAKQIREAVYEDHPGEYESERSWWKNCIQPALTQLAEDGRVELTDRARGQWHSLR